MTQDSKRSKLSNPQVSACGFLLMDKPQGITSFRLLGPVKYNFKPAKVGHAGTLDQEARGLMIVAIGRASRLLQYAEGADKTYEFTLHFGRETVSAEYFHPEVLQEIEGQAVTTRQLENVIPKFLGKIQQTPPQYSAVKIDGKRASDRARSGEEVKIKSREIEIFSLEVIDEDAIQNPDKPQNTFKMRCSCSKGTYIRSLGVDLAKQLGMLGAVSDIFRTRIGRWKIEDALSLEDFKSCANSFEQEDGSVDWSSKSLSLSKLLTLPQDFFPEWPRAIANSEVESKLGQGMKQNTKWLQGFEMNQWANQPGFILDEKKDLVCFAEIESENDPKNKFQGSQVIPKVVFK